RLPGSAGRAAAAHEWATARGRRPRLDGAQPASYGERNELVAGRSGVGLPGRISIAEERTMADGVAFIDGEYMPAHEVKIPLFGRGFTRGDAVYDTVSVWKGRFFRLDDHVARFLRSCAGARLTCPHPSAELKRILAECVHRAGLDDAYVQMIVTRGE